MHSSETIDSMALLRHQSFARLPLYNDSQEALAKQRNYINRATEKAEQTGAVHLKHDGTQVQAFLLYWTEKESWYGVETQNCIIHSRPSEEAGLAWLKSCLENEVSNFNTNFDLILDASDVDIRQFFLNAHFHIDALILIGETAVALQQLSNKPKQARTKDLGLEVVPLKDHEFITEVSELKQKVFSQNKACWFALNPQFIINENEALRESLDQNQPLYLIKSAGKTVGYFGSHIEDTNTYWGSVGNLEFVLDPSIQGKGLARELYRIVLSDLHSAGTKTFKGGSSNPAVLHLSKTMGRQLSATVIRKGPSLKRDFAPYL